MAIEFLNLKIEGRIHYNLIGTVVSSMGFPPALTLLFRECTHLLLLARCACGCHQRPGGWTRPPSAWAVTEDAHSLTALAAISPAKENHYRIRKDNK